MPSPPDPDAATAADHPFARLDRAAVARALSQIADREDDLADAWFECLEVVELPPESASGGGGIRVRREGGLAVRLLRRDETGDGAWGSARDEVSTDAFSDALRQTARVLPTAPYALPQLAPLPWPGPPAAPEVLGFPSAVHRAIRARRAAFPLALTVRRHRRWVQVVGSGPLVPEPQAESFYSLQASLPWGRWGTLLPELDDGAAGGVADALVERFRARGAAPPEPRRGVVVLGPAAAAVLLHEAVAHALESDLLALGGDPEAAVGVELGAPCLDVLDDPSSAPPPVRRDSDDEGFEVRRRWLLRQGVVAEPLADARRAAGSELLTPGAARRAGRHDAPSPRSTHLELAPGGLDEADLLADAGGGLYLPHAAGGRLDPLSGAFHLDLPLGHRIRDGAAGEAVGPCRLVGRVAEVLAAVVAVGSEARSAGAGWCAKGGRKLPVWATCPAVRLEGVEVRP